MIAALYVDPKGVYAGRPDVEIWDEARDARRYDGPWPVVAHPPCARWCLLAGFVQSVYGYQVGDDGGCFESALASVRQFGGVLEHPAFTKAWSRFGLPEPVHGAWRRVLFDPGWVTEVWQVAYGHRARKKTWLYYVGDSPPPSMRWDAPGPVAKLGNFRFRSLSSPIAQGLLAHRRTSKPENKATPPAFAEALIEIARGAR